MTTSYTRRDVWSALQVLLQALRAAHPSGAVQVGIDAASSAYVSGDTLLLAP
jgi:hypothetical protein